MRDLFTQIPATYSGGLLGHHDMVIAVDPERGVQPAHQWRRRLGKREERDGDTGIEMMQDIRLAIEQKVFTAMLSIDVKARHQNRR
jgi:hypothetical protein